MKTTRRSADTPATTESSAQGLRQSKAAAMRSRRAVEEFKKFALANIRDLERGQRLLVIMRVVKDPCGPVPMRTRSGMIKGPPWMFIES